MLWKLLDIFTQSSLCISMLFSKFVAVLICNFVEPIREFAVQYFLIITPATTFFITFVLLGFLDTGALISSVRQF